ncbi:holo-ACP synthase [Paenibacillus sp. CC-CFT747]|nr:holo-ACP synthase [Paenibacillus sp. CC-CFT747]
MIVGVGTDLTDIARIAGLLGQPSGRRFLERVLTNAELALAEERRGRLAEFAAGRFAAKEAVVKALGCGIGRQVAWRDVEVLPDASGRPQCTLSPAARERLGLEPGIRLHLSITHTGTTAAAFAVAEQSAGRAA